MCGTYFCNLTKIFIKFLQTFSRSIIDDNDDDDDIEILCIRK